MIQIFCQLHENSNGSRKPIEETHLAEIRIITKVSGTCEVSRTTLGGTGATTAKTSVAFPKEGDSGERVGWSTGKLHGRCGGGCEK